MRNMHCTPLDVAVCRNRTWVVLHRLVSVRADLFTRLNGAPMSNAAEYQTHGSLYGSHETLWLT